MADSKVDVLKGLQETKFATVHVVGALVVGLLLGGGVMYFVGYTAQGTSLKVADIVPKNATTSSDASNETIQRIAASKNLNELLKVSDQNAGYVVIIENAQVAGTDWIAVQEERNGRPSNVLGAARFIDGERMGTVELLRQTVPGQTYYVSVFKDDGDSSFSKNGDVQVKDPDGNPLYVTFTAK